ncbi:hypothetical protein J1N35_000504 [Gossypium stocksii]|uniref:Uncharacterized protein n=1 Tax=Gossypium stocksii TaxID=47602 RepID=A0A9D3WIG9_9ROSI|nr:hypothetical protein J1N35_000504 [Gossypium stocksii]
MRLKLGSTCHYTPSSAVCSRTTRLHLANSRAFLSGLSWRTSTIFDIERPDILGYYGGTSENFLSLLVIADVGTDHNFWDSLSEIDSIFCEINEAMDINTLISVVEASLPPVVGPSLVLLASSPIALDEDTPPLAPRISLSVPVVEKASVEGSSLYPVSHSMTTKSFALANCVGGRGFYPVSFYMIVGIFAPTNYVRGCDFYPTSLNMTTGSFALTNCVGGYGYSSASLNMMAGSFALANCVGGCGFYSTSLNMTVESFALTNCVGS